MIIVLAHFNNSYVSCDEAFFYEEGTSEKIIDADIQEWTKENGDAFAYLHLDDYYTDEEYEDYMTNCVEYDWHKATYEEYIEWCEDLGCEPVVFD